MFYFLTFYISHDSGHALLIARPSPLGGTRRPSDWEESAAAGGDPGAAEALAVRPVEYMR